MQKMLEPIATNKKVEEHLEQKAFVDSLKSRHTRFYEDEVFHKGDERQGTSRYNMQTLQREKLDRLKAGRKDWSKNQRDKKERQIRDLQFELTTLKVDELKKNRSSSSHRRDQEGGIDSFERNLISNGIGGNDDDGQPLTTTYENGEAFLTRIEDIIQKKRATNEEIGDFLTMLKNRTLEKRQARHEKARRKRRMLVDQKAAAAANGYDLKSLSSAASSKSLAPKMTFDQRFPLGGESSDDDDDNANISILDEQYEERLAEAEARLLESLERRKEQGEDEIKKFAEEFRASTDEAKRLSDLHRIVKEGEDRRKMKLAAHTLTMRDIVMSMINDVIDLKLDGVTASATAPNNGHAPTSLARSMNSPSGVRASPLASLDASSKAGGNTKPTGTATAVAPSKDPLVLSQQLLTLACSNLGLHQHQETQSPLSRAASIFVQGLGLSQGESSHAANKGVKTNEDALGLPSVSVASHPPTAAAAAAASRSAVLAADTSFYNNLASVPTVSAQGLSSPLPLLTIDDVVAMDSWPAFVTLANNIGKWVSTSTTTTADGAAVEDGGASSAPSPSTHQQHQQQQGQELLSDLSAAVLAANATTGDDNDDNDNNNHDVSSASSKPTSARNHKQQQQQKKQLSFSANLVNLATKSSGGVEHAPSSQPGTLANPMSGLSVDGVGEEGEEEEGLTPGGSVAAVRPGGDGASTGAADADHGPNDDDQDQGGKTSTSTAAAAAAAVSVKRVESFLEGTQSTIESLFEFNAAQSPSDSGGVSNESTDDSTDAPGAAAAATAGQSVSLALTAEELRSVFPSEFPPQRKNILLMKEGLGVNSEVKLADLKLAVSWLGGTASASSAGGDSGSSSNKVAVMDVADAIDISLKIAPLLEGKAPIITFPHIFDIFLTQELAAVAALHDTGGGGGLAVATDLIPCPEPLSKVTLSPTLMKIFFDMVEAANRVMTISATVTSGTWLDNVSLVAPFAGLTPTAAPSAKGAPVDTLPAGPFSDATLAFLLGSALYVRNFILQQWVTNMPSENGVAPPFAAVLLLSRFLPTTGVTDTGVAALPVSEYADPAAFALAVDWFSRGGFRDNLPTTDGTGASASAGASDICVFALRDAIAAEADAISGGAGKKGKGLAGTKPPKGVSYDDPAPETLISSIMWVRTATEELPLSPETSSLLIEGAEAAATLTDTTAASALATATPTITPPEHTTATDGGHPKETIPSSLLSATKQVVLSASRLLVARVLQSRLAAAYATAVAAEQATATAAPAAKGAAKSNATAATLPTLSVGELVSATRGVAYAEESLLLRFAEKEDIQISCLQFKLASSPKTTTAITGGEQQDPSPAPAPVLADAAPAASGTVIAPLQTGAVAAVTSTAGPDTARNKGKKGAAGKGGGTADAPEAPVLPIIYSRSTVEFSHGLAAAEAVLTVILSTLHPFSLSVPGDDASVGSGGSWDRAAADGSSDTDPDPGTDASCIEWVDRFHSTAKRIMKQRRRQLPNASQLWLLHISASNPLDFELMFKAHESCCAARAVELENLAVILMSYAQCLIHSEQSLRARETEMIKSLKSSDARWKEVCTHAQRQLKRIVENGVTPSTPDTVRTAVNDCVCRIGDIIDERHKNWLLTASRHRDENEALLVGFKSASSEILYSAGAACNAVFTAKSTSAEAVADLLEKSKYESFPWKLPYTSAKGARRATDKRKDELRALASLLVSSYFGEEVVEEGVVVAADPGSPSSMDSGGGGGGSISVGDGGGGSCSPVSRRGSTRPPSNNNAHINSNSKAGAAAAVVSGGAGSKRLPSSSFNARHDHHGDDYSQASNSNSLLDGDGTVTIELPLLSAYDILRPWLHLASYERFAKGNGNSGGSSSSLRATALNEVYAETLDTALSIVATLRFCGEDLAARVESYNKKMEEYILKRFEYEHRVLRSWSAELVNSVSSLTAEPEPTARINNKLSSSSSPSSSPTRRPTIKTVTGSKPNNSTAAPQRQQQNDYSQQLSYLDSYYFGLSDDTVHDSIPWITGQSHVELRDMLLPLPTVRKLAEELNSVLHAAYVAATATLTTQAQAAGVLSGGGGVRKASSSNQQSYTSLASAAEVSMAATAAAAEFGGSFIRDSGGSRTRLSGGKQAAAVADKIPGPHVSVPDLTELLTTAVKNLVRGGVFMPVSWRNKQRLEDLVRAVQEASAGGIIAIVPEQSHQQHLAPSSSADSLTRDKGSVKGGELLLIGLQSSGGSRRGSATATAAPIDKKAIAEVYADRRTQEVRFVRALVMTCLLASLPTGPPLSYIFRIATLYGRSQSAGFADPGYSFAAGLRVTKVEFMLKLFDDIILKLGWWADAAVAVPAAAAPIIHVPAPSTRKIKAPSVRPEDLEEVMNAMLSCCVDDNGKVAVEDLVLMMCQTPKMLQSNSLENSLLLRGLSSSALSAQPPPQPISNSNSNNSAEELGHEQPLFALLPRILREGPYKALALSSQVSLYPPAGTALLTPYTKQVDLQTHNKGQSQSARLLAKLLGEKYEIGRNQLYWLTNNSSVDIPSLANVENLTVFRSKVGRGGGGGGGSIPVLPSSQENQDSPPPKLLLPSGVCAYVPEVITEFLSGLAGQHSPLIVGDLK